MKMATWRQLIRATSDRITDEDRSIERQRQVIEELNRAGHDAAAAERDLMVQVRSNQLLRERLQSLIASMPGSTRISPLAGGTYGSMHMEKSDV